MKKVILAILFVGLFLIPFISASEIVKIDVAGYISHGPMQPTIDAIKEVTSKYGDKVNVSWYDMNTADGSKFMTDNHLSAHLNILIDGKYTYLVNNKQVTFQWFEGQQWTKADLDSVISDTLNGKSNSLPNSQTTPKPNYFLYAVIGIIVVLIAVFLILAFKKKAKR